MYTLYHNPASQHARRVVSLLEEANLSYTLHPVELREGEHYSTWYLQVNPNHQVPALQSGDLVMYESNAILRYLCHRHQLSTWYPEVPELRARVEQWLDWNQCRFSPSVVDIVLNSVFLGEKGDKEAISRGLARLPELLEVLDKELKEQMYFGGDAPSIADLSIASNIFQLGFAQVSPSEVHVRNWYARMGAIKGFQKSLPPSAAH